MASLGIDRIFQSPPEVVWSAWTQPDQVEAWWWPHLGNRVEMDLKVGGRYRIEGSGVGVSGHYLEVARPMRLAFTWQWDGEDRVSQVALELHAGPDGTLMTVVHIGLADREVRDAHRQGWSDCLDRLEFFIG